MKLKTNEHIKRTGLVEIVDSSSDKFITRESPDAMLVFVINGSVEASYGFTQKRLVRKGYFFLIPPNTVCALYLHDNTRLLATTNTEKIFSCERYRRGLLVKIYEQQNLAAENYDLYTVKTPRYATELIGRMIRLSPIIEEKMRGSEYEDGFLSDFPQQYIENATNILLLLLSVYCPDEEMACLFQPIFKGNFLFKNLVLQNKNVFFSVDEFVASSHLSHSTFSKRFYEVFGQSPHHWIMEQRKDMIFQKLTETSAPMIEIAENSGFSCYSNFCRFCKTYLGMPPAKIRKSQKNLPKSAKINEK
ncbi:MAG: AraC family transcriptional regulator [Dysgonamonadaceae bacterium]|jgi:AraC-like DNA-binding protein|nr:AraC family transcriptional regulator [Dysgonamonadaceae bacterium]